STSCSAGTERSTSASTAATRRPFTSRACPGSIRSIRQPTTRAERSCCAHRRGSGPTTSPSDDLVLAAGTAGRIGGKVTVPREDDIRTVHRLLRASQGPFVPKPGLPILDELIATVLSQHTSDVNSERAFAQLKARFGAWEQVADAPVDE